MTTNTTAPITSSWKPEYIAKHLTVTTLSEDGRTFSISFTDSTAALAALELAKNEDWKQYLREGGNPRNKRGHGAQYAAIKKAILKAAS